MFVFTASGEGVSPQSRRHPTQREPPRRDSKLQKEKERTAGLLREQRQLFRDARRVMGESDDSDLDPDMNMDLDQLRAEGWTTKLTAQQRAVQRAEKDAARQRKANENTRLSTGLRGPQGFEIELEPAREDSTFLACNLLKVYEELRSAVAGAHARVLPKGSLLIRVPNLDDIDTVKSMESVLGVPVRVAAPPAMQLWGRITGVHPMFAEEDLLEALRSQGVEKVMREKYTTKGDSDGHATKVERPSQRVRLLFANKLPDLVTIAYDSYRVTLCPATPLQCLSCLKFGHRSLNCPKKDAPRCRRCGEPGHEMWECEKRARCVNCSGSHSANHHSCPVYATYAKAASERHTNRIAASLPDTKIVDVMVEPSVSPTDVTAGAAEKPTFAAVLGAPAYRKIVRKTDKGEELVCRIPITPSQPKPARPIARPRTKPKAPNVAPVTKGQTSPSAAASFSGALELVRRVWTFVKPLVEPLFKESPALAQVIDILMSEAVLNFIQTSATSVPLTSTPNV